MISGLKSKLFLVIGSL